MVSFAAGLLFAVGLGVSGMTDPAKVTAFLDVFGAWDPSLAFVMAGAIGVHLLPNRLIFARGRPLLDGAFHLPTFTQIDGRLLAGSAIFGVGWGLAGYCPGPAVVASGAGVGQALVFLAAMLGGMGLFQLIGAAQPARVPAKVVTEAV